MGNGEDRQCVFPLTSLQIGDLQSYLSHLSLVLAVESKKFYILVDNRPWLEDPGSRPAHLWQLMVTKSRLSPFANSKRRMERKVNKAMHELATTSKASKPKISKRWFQLVDAATLSKKRALLPVKKLRNSLLLNRELHRTLYGFIVFEVSWTNVRGINYLNELQTDTSLAIEAKFMKRWEFDSIAQAASYISSWFSGTHDERFLLKDYLDSAIGEVFYDAQEDFTGTQKNIVSVGDSLVDECPQCIGNNFPLYSTMETNAPNIDHTPPSDGPYKRRKVTKHLGIGADGDILYSEEKLSNVASSLEQVQTYDCEHAVETTQLKDVLILFRFNDPILPFKLRRIIMSDLRLLRLLESGLPSWVIFLQSYPGFCHLYRPWMCPLVRALYVLISVVTVLIGFYDLYKNVPVLKATASRLCGPLLDWIETWEMVSRIKYLGTMLFLHNFQKAFKWLMMVTRTTRSFLSVITQPMAEPLLKFLNLFVPLWNMCAEAVGSLCSVIWMVIGSSFSLMEELLQALFSPVWLILSFIWTIVTFVLYPVYWLLQEIAYAPIRAVTSLFGCVAFVFNCVYDLVGDLCMFVSGMIQLASASEATVSTHEVSMWRTLWNDLFSQIFRAVRSILNGFVAFCTACNRHRLSIYNHMREIIRRLSRSTQRSWPTDSRPRRQPSLTQNPLKEGRKSHSR